MWEVYAVRVSAGRIQAKILFKLQKEKDAINVCQKLNKVLLTTGWTIDYVLSRT